MINTLKGKCRLVHGFAMCAAVFAATPVWADLARDARTTRIVREEGNLIIENALQFERDRDGKAITFETLSFFAEVFGNTSPVEGEDGSSGVLAGVEYDIEINKHVNPFISVEVDTAELITAKVGLEYTW